MFLCGCFLPLFLFTLLLLSLLLLLRLSMRKKNTFVSCDTFTLFSSFLDGKSKNSKRKSSAIFCLSLTSNSLEKNRTNQTKNSRLWGVLGKARQTGRGCISQDEMSSKRDGRKQGKLSRKKQNTKGLKNTKRKTTFG